MLLGLLTSASASYLLTPPARSASCRAGAPCAVATAPSADTLGQVLYSQAQSELVVIEPAQRSEAKVGELVRFGEGGTGVLLLERCGLYFAARLGDDDAKGSVELLGAPLEVEWAPDGAWGGEFDYLGRGAGSQGAPAPGGGVQVFCEPVPQQQRKPISQSVHCGVVALDALTPMGRGQSMALFAPDGLPEGSGRSELAQRVLIAQSELDGLRCILVLSGAPPERRAAIEALRDGGALENTRVLVAETAMQGVIASQVACSLAAAVGGDVLVVVDSLAPQLELWRASCAALQAKGVEVRAEEEGSQQRTMYSMLTERAVRRKEGGSITMLLLQPSASVLAAEGARKASYTLADFEREGFSQRACARVALLADKGVAITDEVLVKLGIPSPGSGHPQGGGARREYQHLEELTSLVDGHIDLRENLAAAGRCPPLDPSNSLTRIGIGSAQTLRTTASTPAMLAVTKALRLELAAASDPAGCEPRVLRRAAAYHAVLQQPAPRPMPLGEQVALLLAASEGLLDAPAGELPADEMGALLGRLLEHLRAAAPEQLRKIGASGVLLDEAADELRALVGAFLRPA